MFVYRVFPHLASAPIGTAGHPKYVHPAQGAGRWDNPDQYLAFYVATTAEGAIGETFAHLSTWGADMLEFPALPGARRALGIYQFDEEKYPILDLDDPKELIGRSIRPSEVVMRTRPHSQKIARKVWDEKSWAGIGWWSMHRPQWQLRVLFDSAITEVINVEDLVGHPALHEAGARLARVINADLA